MKQISTFLFLLLFISFPVRAELEFNGFASIIGGKTLGKGETAYGYDHSFGFKPETRFALQANADLGDNLSATVQVLARGRENFEAKFEWAYLSYKFGSNTIHAGNIRVPLYRESEHIETGYVYHWVRPPAIVYNTFFNTWTGTSFVNKHFWGEIDGTFQIQYGRADDDSVMSPAGLEVELDLKGVALEYLLNWENWQARVGFMNVNVSIYSELNPLLIQSVEALKIQGIDVPQQYIDNVLTENDSFDYLSAAINYDNAEFFASAEYIRATQRDVSIIPDINNFFVTAGWRLDESWTIHTTYGEAKLNKRSHSELLDGVSADVLTLGVLSGLSNSLTSKGEFSGEDSKYVSVGVNYMFNPKAVLKLDFTSYRNDVATGNPDADTLSFGVDLVF